MKVQLIQGTQAESLLDDANFRSEWLALWQRCPWSTGWQHPGFATSWYQSYRRQYEPVLLVSRGERGTLQGLLTLASSAAGRELVGAGAGQAEYHAWITDPELGDTFASQAIAAVRREFPDATVKFRYLPPGAPTGWLAGPNIKRCRLLRTHHRPLMRFGDGEEIAASLNKRGNKGRLRRLKRRGPVEFRRITDPAEFEAMIDTIGRFYDSRHLAVNRKAPFEQDPCKKPFHLAMMKVPGLLHLSVLTAGSELASVHIDMPANKKISTGLIAHNPWMANDSPGKLHLLLLAQDLMTQGYQELDLTPGGDPYKERFANAGDTVQSLAVFASPLQRWKTALTFDIQDGIKRLLIKLGVRPSRIGGRIEELKRLGPIGVAARLLRRTKAWAWSRRQTEFYGNSVGSTSLADAADTIHRDALDDLLLYRDIPSGASRCQFMAEAMRRVEQGQHLYSHVVDGRLQSCIWVIEEPSEETLRQVVPGLSLPPKSALVLDSQVFFESSADNVGSMCLEAILRDLSQAKEIDAVFVAVPSPDQAWRSAAERANFSFEGSIIHCCRFGRNHSTNLTIPARPARKQTGRSHRREKKPTAG